MATQHHNAASESAASVAAKVTPAAGYVGAQFGGMSLPDWAALAALVYSGLMILHFLYVHVIKPLRAKRRGNLRRRASDFAKASQRERAETES